MAGASDREYIGFTGYSSIINPEPGQKENTYLTVKGQSQQRVESGSGSGSTKYGPHDERSQRLGRKMPSSAVREGPFDLFNAADTVSGDVNLLSANDGTPCPSQVGRTAQMDNSHATYSLSPVLNDEQVAWLNTAWRKNIPTVGRASVCCPADWAIFSARYGTKHALADLRVLYAYHRNCDHPQAAAVPVQPYRDFTDAEANVARSFARANFTEKLAQQLRVKLSLPESWSQEWMRTLVHRPKRGNDLTGPGQHHREDTLRVTKRRAEAEAKQQTRTLNRGPTCANNLGGSQTTNCFVSNGVPYYLLTQSDEMQGRKTGVANANIESNNHWTGTNMGVNQLQYDAHNQYE